ncbi:RNA methyltransferase [Polycyclovorans algicola]|uniref:RNA methyltransferase n=1 Tax=Polycyclovorans algicola TaxID=616992 RepID=UPI000693BD1F|nr:RNA methyltransferase [Polycyclovorans algicola]
MTSIPDAEPPATGIRIVLVQTQHPGNIGSTARAMRTMGFEELVLVSPERFPHPQARALASNALPVVENARVVGSLQEAIADCGWVVATSARPRHLGDEPLTPWDFAETAQTRAKRAKVALVFGPERTGLSNEDLERCNAVIMVPTDPTYASLNLAQAVQLMTWELRKAGLAEVPKVSAKHEHPSYAPPTADEMAHFYEHLERVLLKTGFLDPRNPRLLMRRLRQFYHRAQPDRNELNILRGILTTVETPKIRTPKAS